MNPARMLSKSSLARPIRPQQPQYRHRRHNKINAAQRRNDPKPPRQPRRSHRRRCCPRPFQNIPPSRLFYYPAWQRIIPFPPSFPRQQEYRLPIPSIRSIRV